MLTGLVAGQKPSIKIVPYQGVFQLHPPSKYEHLDDNAPHGPDETFWGTVVLSLPKSRQFTSLLVTLSAPYVLNIPGHAQETGTLFESHCPIDIPQKLDKGEHSFAWALNVARSAAPYERSPFGTVRHKLVAVAEGPSGSIREEMLLEVVINPSAEGETSIINERIEGFNDETGPYLFTLASPHLTVGGLIHFSLTLAAAPVKGLVVHNVVGTIMQSYRLKSPKDGTVVKPPAHERMLFRLDGGTQFRSPGDVDVGLRSGHRPMAIIGIENSAEHGMAVLAAGETLKSSYIARLPIDERLRATSHEGSDSPFRIEHTIVVTMTFSTPGQPAQRMLRIERPLNILSCGCMPGSLVLPSYDDAVEEPKEKIWRVKHITGTFYACMCLYKITTLLGTKHFNPLIDAHEAFARPDTPSEDVFRANKR
ncbi:hypothetical protein BKA62DRAFT_642042, partial [Auriculariales sp. MPI-PUGE-AT-0066]